MLRRLGAASRRVAGFEAALCIGLLVGCTAPTVDRQTPPSMGAGAQVGSAATGAAAAAGIGAGQAARGGVIDNAPPPPVAGVSGPTAGTMVVPPPPDDSAAGSLLRDACKKSTVESNLLPANILFVLDRSGSMQCNPPPTTQSEACERMPARADNNAPSKWQITTQALTAAIHKLPASASVGLMYFSNDDECGVSATPSVPILPNSAAQQAAIDQSLQSVMPGGGTPIVGATILAYAHMHQSALAGRIYGNEFVVLITDGAQSEACSYAPRCKDATMCTSLLLSEDVPKAAGAGVGIRTFVVGVPGSEPARSVLSQIAKQGATALPGCDPQQGNCHFDMTMVPDLGAALSGALAKISGQAVSCELNVPKPDQGDLDPTLVNVVYATAGSGSPTVVRQDTHAACDGGANGWQYSDDKSKIRLCGDICNTIRSDAGARVDVVLGCPSLLQ